MSVDWDNLTREEVLELHRKRRQLERYLGELINKFRKETGLEIDDVYYYVIDGKYYLQLRVPMRCSINYEESDE